MNVSLFSCFLALEAICLLSFFLLGLSSYSKRKKKRYDFLTLFPFELGEDPKGSDYVSRGFFASFELASVGGAIFLVYFYPAFKGTMSLSLLLGLLFLLRGISAVGVISIPTYTYKPHLAFAVAHMGFSLISDIVAGLFFRDLASAYNDPIGNTFMIIMFVLALLLAILMLNPKLSHWAELKSEMSKDGSVTTKRPRPFVLALTEWICIGLDAIVSIAVLLGFFLLTTI